MSIKELKDATTASEVILNYILQNIDQNHMSVKVDTLRYLCDGENYTDLLASSAVSNFMNYDAKKHKEGKSFLMSNNFNFLSDLDSWILRIIFRFELYEKTKRANFLYIFKPILLT